MEKIKYIKGNQEHSRKIENYFVSNGAEHIGRSTYALENFAYFVNPDTGCVDGYSVESWEFKALVEAGIFEELKYPYTESKPKLKVIQGDPLRGDDVIALLESLGGINDFCGGVGFDGNDIYAYYFINEHSSIGCIRKDDYFFKDYDLEVLTLPKKMGKPKLKVVRGDYFRGDEVISLLESLGGVNSNNLVGESEDVYYYIDQKSDGGVIDYNFDNSPFFDDYDLEVLTLPGEEESPKEPETAKFVPFVSKVLVRNNPGYLWMPAFFFSEESGGGARWYHIVGTYDPYRECIPYEGNEELAFTSNDVRSM